MFYYVCTECIIQIQVYIVHIHSQKIIIVISGDVTLQNNTVSYIRNVCMYICMHTYDTYYVCHTELHDCSIQKNKHIIKLIKTSYWRIWCDIIAF
jgi:hypothetical protein